MYIQTMSKTNLIEATKSGPFVTVFIKLFDPWAPCMQYFQNDLQS